MLFFVHVRAPLWVLFRDNLGMYARRSSTEEQTIPLLLHLVYAYVALELLKWKTCRGRTPSEFLLYLSDPHRKPARSWLAWGYVFNETRSSTANVGHSISIFAHARHSTTSEHDGGSSEERIHIIEGHGGRQHIQYIHTQKFDGVRGVVGKRKSMSGVISLWPQPPKE